MKPNQTKTKTEFDESDLVIFPPFTARFIAAIMLMIFSHALWTLVFLLYLLEVKIEFTMIAGFVFLLVIVFSNIAITRGHGKAVVLLKVCAWVYILCSVLAIVLDLTSVKETGIGLALINCFLAAVALITIRSPGYVKLVEDIEQRWEIYRRTGKTVIETLYPEKNKTRK